MDFWRSYVPYFNYISRVLSYDIEVDNYHFRVVPDNLPDLDVWWEATGPFMITIDNSIPIEDIQALLRVQYPNIVL